MKPPIPDPHDGDKRSLPDVLMPFLLRYWWVWMPAVYGAGFIWQYLHRVGWVPVGLSFGVSFGLSFGVSVLGSRI